MKVLLAHKYMWRGGGTATYLFALMEELERRGHEWIPFTVAYDKTAVNTYDEYFVTPPLGAGESHYEQMRLSPLAMLKLLGRATYSLEARDKAARLIDDTAPHIAYIHNIYNYMSPSVLDACACRELPVVMRVPDYNLMCAELHFLRHGEMCTECIKGSYWKAVQHRCLKSSFAASAARAGAMYMHKWLHIYDNVDLFITPSAFMRERLIEAGFDGDRIVHLQSFYPGQIPQTERAPEGDYVLYFGRVAPEKAIDTLIKAAARLDRDVRVLIAGADVDGTEAQLRQLAADVGAERVEFVGFQDRESLDRLIAGSLFTVVPSRWFDNCPMAVLESFAHGKPVVASDVGGIPEQITEDCGILCEHDNPEQLAGAMQTLIDDSALRHTMGDAARKRLQTHYSPELHCDRLLELFERLIA
ncbi:MAG: glycosyltransferase family 4 protein [candidate division WS1 bacterium]|jgi:glycosyltransferase involved in cell wall biosynthesis|nr:glycosyltransferase family 4 protein [candidate division WS1 bacterium]